jgi:hypothetical protein
MNLKMSIGTHHLEFNPESSRFALLHSGGVLITLASLLVHIYGQLLLRLPWAIETHPRLKRTY